MRSIAITLVCSALACGDDGEPVPLPCLPPDRIVYGGLCLAPGVQDDGCAAGTLAIAGACVPAGLTESSCAAGFSFVAGSCEPVLPAEPCAPGSMALPGEASCRAVLDCPATRWGRIAPDADAEYVDASYQGVENGSQAQPWNTIGEALAASGAIVAVAAGSYPEDVVVQKPVQIIGDCPAQVAIVGASTALRFAPGATGGLLRGVALTGAGDGLIASGALELVVEQVWIHDAPARGIDVEEGSGATSLTLRQSLIEANRNVGVFVGGSQLRLEGVVVRDTQPGPVIPGLGLIVLPSLRGAPASVTVLGALIERNHDIGVLLRGSTLLMEGAVVRNTQASAAGSYGRGIEVELGQSNGLRSSLTLRQSLIDQNHDIGVYLSGSDATIEDTVVRGTQAGLDTKTGGEGIDIESDDGSGERSNATVRRCLVDRNGSIGVFTIGSDALLEGVVVRDTQTDPATGDFGWGIGIEDTPLGLRSNVTIRGALVERNVEAGLVVAGSDVVLHGLIVRDTAASGVDGLFGRGIGIQAGTAPSTVDLRGSVFERNREAAIFLGGSSAELHAILVRETSPNGAGLHGDGLLLVTRKGVRSEATLSNSSIDTNARAGAVAFGGLLSLREVRLGCNGLDIVSQDYEGVISSVSDDGGNACGCGAPVACKAVSADLTPPGDIGVAGL